MRSVLQGFAALGLDKPSDYEVEVLTMFQRKVRALMLLGWALICVAPGKQSDAREEKIVKIPSASGEPAFVLQISTERSRGIVSVRDERGAEVQRLVCPLLRDNSEPTEDELAAVREQFVAHFVVSDFDFDQHADLAGIREFGAKWARYCVWLYDPKQHIFAKDFLAEQMELLTNLEPLTGGQISSSHMGPENMWRAVYRVAGAEGSRPKRQLVPVYSCLVETLPGARNPTAVTITGYANGNAVTTGQEAAKMDISAAFRNCISSKKSKVGPKPNSQN
jgi:hypothetical protein